MPQAAPGWYADPYDPSRERVWDGSAWTSETRIPPAKASSSPGPTAWGTPPDTWTTQAPTWSPPSMPQPEHTALYPASTTNWRRIGLIVGAIVLPVIGFAAGYAAHQSDDARQPAASFGPTPTTGSEPANVNVPGPTAPPGVDTAGAVAEQNLGMAAN